VLLANSPSSRTLARAGDDDSSQSERDLVVDKFVARTTTASGVSYYLEDAAAIEQIAASLR
jgi:hypothetical protein